MIKEDSFFDNIDKIFAEGSKLLKYPQFKLPGGKGLCNKMLQNAKVKIKEPVLINASWWYTFRTKVTIIQIL